jgi:hypothetical protein
MVNPHDEPKAALGRQPERLAGTSRALFRPAMWGVPVIAALSLGSPVGAQQPSTPGPCQELVLRGRVTANETFEAPLSPTLVFRLEADTLAANPPGWTLRVTPPDAPDRDHAMVATPPYRFSNPRYVDTGYGISADQALAYSPREFGFVASGEDFDRATRALDVLLWSYSFTDAQVDSASAEMDALRVYPASFTIEDGRASAASIDHPLGRIEWMSFRLDACVPGA